MSVLNSLIEDAAKLATRATDIGKHQRALTSKLGKQIEEEGVEAINKKLPDVLGGVHKEMKGQGWNMVDYASDAHVGHEIEGMAARRVEGFSGTRATWQHPETGSMAEFDMSRMQYNGGRPLGASDPSLQLPGSRASGELHAAGRQRQKEGYAALRELDAAGNASMQAVLDRRKAPAQSPIVAAANAPQAPAPQAAAPQAPSPSPAAQPPVPAAEPAAAPGKGKGKGKGGGKGKGKGGGGKPAAPSVAQGSPVSAAQAAPPAPAAPPSSGERDPLDPAYKAELAAKLKNRPSNPVDPATGGELRGVRASAKTFDRPAATTGSGAPGSGAPGSGASSATAGAAAIDPMKMKRDADKLRRAAGKPEKSKYPREDPGRGNAFSKWPREDAPGRLGPKRKYEKPRVSHDLNKAGKNIDQNPIGESVKLAGDPSGADSPGLKQKRHWGKGQKNLLAGMAIDAIGMPAIGGLLGALKGGYSYDPEQEQNDRYRGTEVIGRGNAMVQGAIAGAGYGAAAAFGSGVMKGAGSLMGNGAFTHGGSVLGSFARGVKTGYKGKGTDTWTNTVGSSMAGESAIAADVMHKSSMAEVDRFAKESGIGSTSLGAKATAASRRESFFGGMLRDHAETTPGADDSQALQNWLRKSEKNKPSLSGNAPSPGIVERAPFRSAPDPGRHTPINTKTHTHNPNLGDGSPGEESYSDQARRLYPMGRTTGSGVRKTSGVNTDANTDVVGPFNTDRRAGLKGWNSVGAALSSIPNMLGNALGIAVGTVPMSIGKADDWYGESVSPGDNILPWKRKLGKQPLKDWASRHGGTTENPMFDATKEASSAFNPFGENKKTTWNGKQTLSQIGAYALVGGGIIGNSGYSMLEDSAYSGPSSHPINALFNRPDQALTARAQAEADAAEKIRMTKPQELGLRDAEENYFQNPNLRPVRNGHKPGQYNDSGDLVFALSALRRGQ